VRGWELRLRYLESTDIQPKYLSHGGSFIQVCKAGDLDIVKAMIERTQVDMEAKDEYDITPLHWAAQEGHLLVVQYLCE